MIFRVYDFQARIYEKWVKLGHTNHCIRLKVSQSEIAQIFSRKKDGCVWGDLNRVSYEFSYISAHHDDKYIQ